MSVYLSPYLLVCLLLGHSGRYEAWLAWKHMAIQIQWGNMITYRRDRKQQIFSLGLLKGQALIKQEKRKTVLPCMDMEGATDATGIGGMDTPPKEL